MNEEILNNIWNTLSNDPNASLKAQDFEEWKNSFINNKNIQSNVYDYLKQNHNVKANNLEEWITGVMGKTEGTQEIDAPVVPNVNFSGSTELASELSGLGLDGQELKTYEDGLNKALAKTEVEMEEVLKLAEKAPTSQYLATKGFLGQFEKRNVYAFQDFLNEDQSNIEEAKEKWIQQEREKIQSRNLEKVFEELKSDVLPWWTGPVGIYGSARKILGPQSSVVMINEDGEKIEQTPDALPFGLGKQEEKYEKV